MKKLLLQKILERPEGHAWSLQGLGMLRLYLSEEVRLHVWDSRFRVPNVSTIHTHPWDFESEILCGEIVNLGYTRAPGVPTHHEQTIVCGTGGGLVKGELGGAPGSIRLEVEYTQTSLPGDIYHQEACDIHESLPEDGTVSVITRRFKKDREHARVFFPLGTPWVSAEPRPATLDEVKTICAGAFARLLRERL